MTKQGLWQTLSPAVSVKWMIHNLTEIVQAHRAETQELKQKIVNIESLLTEQRELLQKRTPTKKTTKSEEAA